MRFTASGYDTSASSATSIANTNFFVVLWQFEAWQIRKVSILWAQCPKLSFQREDIGDQCFEHVTPTAATKFRANMARKHVPWALRPKIATVLSHRHTPHFPLRSHTNLSNNSFIEHNRFADTMPLHPHRETLQSLETDIQQHHHRTVPSSQKLYNEEA